MSGRVSSPTLTSLELAHLYPRSQEQLHCAARPTLQSAAIGERWGQLSRVPHPVMVRASSAQPPGYPGVPGDCWTRNTSLFSSGNISHRHQHQLAVAWPQTQAWPLVAAQARTLPWSWLLTSDCSSLPSSFQFCLSSLCPHPSVSLSLPFLHHLLVPLSGVQGLSESGVVLDMVSGLLYPIMHYGTRTGRGHF